MNGTNQLSVLTGDLPYGDNSFSFSEEVAYRRDGLQLPHRLSRTES